MKNRPEGVETSESEELSDEEVYDLPKKLANKNKVKRKSVSAEVYGVYNPKGDFKPPVYEKPEE